MAIISFGMIREIEMQQISCGLITSYEFLTTNQVKDCTMDAKQSINTTNLIFRTRDNTMEVLSFWNIKTVFYLPTKIAAAFPVLTQVRAINCSIKEVFRHNFIGLNEMKILLLPFNQIEKIASDTFEGLKNLEHIGLRKF
jgi:hypothetical protein